MTDNELNVIVSATVKELFKKIIPKKKALIDESTNALFIKMREQGKKYLSPTMSVC